MARSWAPIFPVHAYDAEGNLKYDENGLPIYDAGTGQTDGTTTRPTATNQNLIANLNEDIRRAEYNNLTSRSYIEFKFLKHFTFTANYSYDFTNDSETLFYTPTIGDGASFGGRGTKGSFNTTTTNFNQILAYSNIFRVGHNLSAKIGHEYYNYKYSYLAGQKTNFFNPTNPELNNGGQMQYIDSYTDNHSDKEYYQLTPFIDIEEEQLLLPSIPNCEMGRWHPAFVDVTAKGNTKQRGIDEIIRHFGIRLEETMAFGDGGNDISMLRHAGIGVAMGNAKDDVKAAAGYVTTSVDDNGIANALKQYGIIKS